MSQHDDIDLDKFLDGDSELSQIYKADDGLQPPAGIDAKILAQAEQAVSGQSVSTDSGRMRWLLPLSVAATVLLGVNLAVNLKDFTSGPGLSESDTTVMADREFEEKRRQAARSRTSSTADDTDTGDAAIRAPVRKPSIRETLEQVADRSGEPVTRPEADTGDSVDDVLGRLGDQESPALAPARLPTPVANQKPRSTDLDAGSGGSIKSEAGETPGNMPRTEPSPVDRTDETRSNRDRQIATRAEDARRAEENRLAAQQQQESGFATRSPDISTKDDAADNMEMVVMSAPPQPAADEPDQTDSEAKYDQVIVTANPRPGKSGEEQDLSVAQEAVGLESGREADENMRLEEVVMSNSSLDDQKKEPYECDLDDLEINADDITQAKYDALNQQPPLDALTWQLFILDAAKFDEYRDACRHLAAYTDQHGKHLLPPDFPVRLPE